MYVKSILFCNSFTCENFVTDLDSLSGNSLYV